MQKDYIEAQEESRNKFFKTQAEREVFLQEFKENVIISLKKEDVESGLVSPEIIEAMHEPDAVLLKMRRDIPLKFLKPYIDVAKEIGIRYTLIDTLSIIGDIGIVIVSKDAMDYSDEDISADTLEQKFIKHGLDGSYSRHLGEKICKRHFDLLTDKYPLYRGSFTKLSLLDRLLGQSCPICDEEGKNNGRGI